MNYLEEIQKGVNILADCPTTLFVGQAVQVKGTALYHQVKHIDINKRIEFPVAEDFQAGFCLGLAIQGYIPVCIYPRFDFALLACNQIVNHIDKWQGLTNTWSKVIIKIAVGSKYPLDPGVQHKADYTEAFRSMCKNINIYDLIYKQDIVPSYEQALIDNQSSILIEHGDLYEN
jgi:pyruvate/2-oxoglutarate/acetoin dehydrogenase E1 component